MKEKSNLSQALGAASLTFCLFFILLAFFDLESKIYVDDLVYQQSVVFNQTHSQKKVMLVPVVQDKKETNRLLHRSLLISLVGAVSSFFMVYKKR